MGIIQECFRTKKQLVLDSQDRILNLMLGYYQLFVSNDQAEQVMVNIINLIRLTDAVDPRIDAEIISKILLPVMTCEKCVRCGDLFQECVECVQQMCAHYYIGSEVTQFAPIISDMIA